MGFGDEFVIMTYHAGGYDDPEAFSALAARIENLEASLGRGTAPLLHLDASRGF